ncbi:MAG: DEAD/DEAH box helicase family protein [Synergistaceae bacterium]|nr:DEAD/DEAH box helicase family protein [Synergistaceae bacterium]
MAGEYKNKLTYDDLLQENAALRTEIAKLKQKLDVTSVATPPVLSVSAAKDKKQNSLDLQSRPHIHKRSSPDEKIELFMQLFFGRTDVYAKRYENKRTGKSGYVPACGNEWIRGVCEKPKVKCSKCPNRDLLPLTKKVIDRHLRGKDLHGEDVVGVYPMLPDETCRFLVADFDDENWQEDVTVFWNVCRQHCLCVYVERSRSGNGAHIWFFFEEPISCATARRLGSGLLTAAMERRHNLSFSSYDRFLPNQDTMPTGGFGNLIALPLQGLVRKKGYSEFVDEQFESYPDQWAYLAGVQKITVSQAEELATTLSKSSELGVLAETETELKPWGKRPSVATLTVSDFPPVVELVRANGIYLLKQGCSERAMGRVKRLAAFKNPDFYKSQAMHLPTYNKPRIICTAWETHEYICIPRGLETNLLELIKGVGSTAAIQEISESGRPIKVDFLGELYAEQKMAAEALLAHNNGVLSATTAFGKTVTAAFVIAAHKVNTLVLVHTQALMNQWKASLEGFLKIDESIPEQPKSRGRRKQLSQIGLLGGGKNHMSGIIDIAIIGSLVDRGDAKPLVRDYGMVIVDECHHVPASRFETVLREVTAKYVYGLSATPIRQDGHHPIIFQQCGPIRYRVDAKEQSLVRGLSHILIPRLTRFRKPVTEPETWPIMDVYARLTESKTRNDLILQDITHVIQEKGTPLILTERVEHAKMLTAELQKAFPDVHVFFLSGKGSAKEKQTVLNDLRNLPASEPLAIVATGKYVGEGFDMPKLDTLFVTMPIAWKGTVSQYAGRLHRIYEGKQEVVVYDYVDIHVPVLERMYYKRLAAYSTLGYSVQAFTADPDPKIGTIFNQQNLLPVLSNDMEQATNEIIIVSPYLSKGRVNQMKRLFLTANLQGKDIVVFTRPPESFSNASRQKVTDIIADLKNSNVKVIVKERIHQKLAVMDRRVVWYGSINLLSYGKSEESMMRFENREIAEELLMELEKDIL